MLPRPPSSLSTPLSVAFCPPENIDRPLKSMHGRMPTDSAVEPTSQPPSASPPSIPCATRQFLARPAFRGRHCPIHAKISETHHSFSRRLSVQKSAEVCP